MPAGPTNAVYKIYDNDLQDWVIYHLRTNAGQVTTTYDSTTGKGRKFVTPSITINGNTAGTTGAKVTVGSDDAANIEVDGAHITGQATPVSGKQLQNIDASDTVAVALGRLDNAIETVVPDGVLTTSNFGDNDKYPHLNAIESVSANLSTLGFLKRTADNTWTFDNTTYVPNTTTVNGNALSGNITINGTQVPYGSGSHTVASGTSVTSVIDSVWDIAEGKNRGYSINCTTESIWPNHCQNRFFNSSDDYIDILVDVDYDSSTDTYSTDAFILPPNGNLSTDKVYLTDINKFDNIYIIEEDIPDRWLASVDYLVPVGQTHGGALFRFYKLETTKVNLGWSNIGTASDPKPTTLSGYGVTDADTSINTTTGAITIKGVSVTPIYDISGKYDKTGGTITGDVTVSNSSIFVDTNDATDKIQISGPNGVGFTVIQVGSGVLPAIENIATYKDAGITLTGIATTGALQNTYTLSFPLLTANATIATQSWSYDNFSKITASSTAPSNPRTGDCWIDTTTIVPQQ